MSPHRRVVIVLFSLLLLLGAVSTSAFAHNWDWCGDGSILKWPNHQTTHNWPTTWATSYQNAIRDSVTNFNTSDFDFYGASVNAAAVLWYNLNSSDTGIAGAASIWAYCDTNQIAAGSLYLNFPHFAASSHTQNQIRCTVIHEMAHIAGFDHNTTTSVLKTPHNTRCHGSTVIYTLQTHDKSDINGRY